MSQIFRSISCINICAVILLAATAKAQTGSQPFSSQILKLREYLKTDVGKSADIVALLNKNVLITSQSDFFGNSRIDYWNVKTNRVVRTIFPPTPIDADTVTLSNDLRLLGAYQSITLTPAYKLFSPHKVLFWNPSTRSLIKTIDLGSNIHIDGLVFSSRSSHRAILTAANTENESDTPAMAAGIIRHHSLSDRVMFINLDTNQVDKQIEVDNAREMHQNTLTFSPNGLLLMGVLPVSEGNAGSLLILDVVTGKITAEFYGDFEAHTVTSPFFFLSNTQIVCNNFIYDLTTQRSTPLFALHDVRLKCVSDVPGKPGYAFFLTKAGLELWYIPMHKMIRRWHSIKRADHLYFALDHSAMGVLQGETLQLWPFDPRKLLMQ